jgi:hypothetical protein
MRRWFLGVGTLSVRRKSLEVILYSGVVQLGILDRGDDCSDQR